MTRIIAALFLIPALLFSCTRGLQTDNMPGDKLVVGLEGNPITLDPRLARDAYSTRILPLLFHSLVKLNEGAEIVPDAAETWEVNDGRIYTFHLRRGIRFAHGRELIADDVKYSIQSLADPALKSPYLDLVHRIKDIQVLDPYTIVIKLKTMHAPILSQLTIGIVPRDSAEENGKNFGRAPVGSGPYLVKRFEAGGEIELEPNPCFSGREPGVSRIIFRVIPDDVTRIMALKRGEVQILQNSVPPDDLQALKKDPGINVKTRPGINYTYIGFNLKDPVLAHRKVREAIAQAIPRDQIINCLLRGQAKAATGILAPSHWAYEQDVKDYNYDPEAAKALLDEAGYPDPDGKGSKPRFRLLYKTSQNKVRRWMAESIAHDLKKVGIEVEVRSHEFGTLFADILAGNFQIYSLTWVGVTEPDMYYTIFHSESVPPLGANRGRYENPEVDRLTEFARITLDMKERREAYSVVQRIIANDIPYVSLFYSMDVVAADKRLKGFRIFPGGDWRSLSDVYWSQE
jgi:peptide/nickel transport system substrate-binding protein